MSSYIQGKITPMTASSVSLQPGQPDTHLPDSQSVIDAQARVSRNRTVQRLWLGLVLAAIFALVLVGGATRLTDSGLSITEWKPIHGVIPPLSEAEWQEELELYRQIPEYQLINKGMSLDEFKVIYWWEWAHRLSGAWRRRAVCRPVCVLSGDGAEWKEGCAGRFSAFWCWAGCRVLWAGGWSPPDWSTGSMSANTGLPPISRLPA
jgi:hypothetical protein